MVEPTQPERARSDGERAPPREGRLARARAAVAADRLWYGLFAGLWLCTLVPLWLPRFLPLLDMPDHLDAIAIWHRYHDASWGYAKYYELNLIPLPYWGYFFPVHLLSYVFPIEIANKIFLSLYTLALPLAVAVLARRMGRSRWLVLFAFPLVFNLNFSYGFITFCIGTVLLIFAIITLDLFLESPTRKRALALCLLALGLYTTHVLPWMFFGVITIPLALCHGWRPRRLAAALALELPSLLLAIYGYHASANGTTAVHPGAFAYEAKREAALDALQQLPTRLIATWGSDGATWLLLLLCGCWLALLSTARADDDERAPAPAAFRYRLELVTACAAACYFLLPQHLLKPVDLWMISGRFITIVALFGALLPLGTIEGRRRWLLVPVVFVSIVYPIDLGIHWLQFDRRAVEFRRLMHEVPRGSSTLVLLAGDYTDPSVDPEAVPWVQFHAYAQFLSGGYDPWALATGFPYTQKPGAALPAPRWKHPHTFNFDDHGVHYDFIITKTEGADYALFGPDDAARAPIVDRQGDWRLYEVRK